MEILFILRVTIWSVFQNPVTYSVLVVRNKSRPKSNYVLIITSLYSKKVVPLFRLFQLGQSIVQVKLQRLYFC